MFSTILFDLDGTLTDPGEGITNSVAYALERFGFSVPERECLYPFIGPPLRDSFMKYYGMDMAQADAATATYREYFSAKGWQENVVYDGIEGLLNKLHKAGKRLIVATSKPEVFAREILRYFNLTEYFYYAAGANLDGTLTDKAEVIAYALKEGGVTDKSTVVMIGDREHDIIGAKKNGVDSIGVLYGYGSREELETAGADCIVATVEELTETLL